MTPTIEDVAKLAGVSIKTVSRVVNMEPNVRATTRDKVQSAIQELGYQPNPSARSLAGKRSFLIGLLYDSLLAGSSYVVNVQGGVLSRCHLGGYELLIRPLDYQSEDLATNISSIIQKTRIDGAILIPPIADLPEVTSLFDDAQKPYVRLSPAEIHQTTSPNVHTDDQGAAQIMTEHLLGLGHRNIAFVIGHPDHKAVALRKTGYKTTMESAGIHTSDAYFAQGYNTFESGIEAGRRLLALDPRPTAIFASNDDMAAGVMSVAHEMGIDIPRQLSVAGFDNSAIAQQIWPTLTTIRQPVQEMAQAATTLLLERLRAGKSAQREIAIPCEMILRNSTGPAPSF